MATSNNDRISSRRLLDTLKGLQASRHLGSEPEVTTETVEYPAKVRPVAGTYPNTEQGLLNVLSDSAIDVEHNLPVKVYGLITRDANGFTVPDKSGEPVATLDVVSEVEGLTVISDIEITSEMIENQPITGHYFMLNSNGVGYGCYYEKADLTNANTMHVWETTASTKTTTTKTKHTIKQDYVPNADWSQNDADGDGYVENRTHWSEIVETEATVNVMSGVQIGNFATGSCDEFNAVKGFTYPNGEYNPGRTGEIITIGTSEDAMQVSYLGEDVNGNAITPTNVSELESALQTTNIGIMLLKQDGGIMAYIAYPNVAQGDVCSVILVLEQVHKLDKKYYDVPTIKAKNLLNYTGWDTKEFNENGVGMGQYVSNAYSNFSLMAKCAYYASGEVDAVTLMRLYCFYNDDRTNPEYSSIAKYLNSKLTRPSDIFDSIVSVSLKDNTFEPDWDTLETHNSVSSYGELTVKRVTLKNIGTGGTLPDIYMVIVQPGNNSHQPQYANTGPNAYDYLLGFRDKDGHVFNDVNEKLDVKIIFNAPYIPLHSWESNQMCEHYKTTNSNIIFYPDFKTCRDKVFTTIRALLSINANTNIPTSGLKVGNCTYYSRPRSNFRYVFDEEDNIGNTAPSWISKYSEPFDIRDTNGNWHKCVLSTEFSNTGGMSELTFTVRALGENESFDVSDCTVEFVYRFNVYQQ